MNIKQKLGLRIKELRRQRKLSQEKLSEMIDISQNSLSKIEIGDNFISSETLEKLLQSLDVSILELFDFEHVKDDCDLITDINMYIKKLDKEKLVLLHKILQARCKPSGIVAFFSECDAGKFLINGTFNSSKM